MALPGLSLSTGSPFAPEAEADVLAVLVTDAVEAAAVEADAVEEAEAGAPRVEVGHDEITRVLHLDVAGLLAREKNPAKPGEVLSVPVVDETSPLAVLLLAGAGDRTSSALRRAGAAVARRARGRRRLMVALDLDPDALRAFVEGLALAAYTFSLRSQPAADSRPVEHVTFLLPEPDRVSDAFDRAVATAQAVHLARDLANTPSGQKTPQWLAEQAALVAGSSGLSVRVRDEHELAAEGFGGLLAVGSGSARSPRLVELSYVPDGANGAGAAPAHVVLVGKGITFDSGGLSLKPREAMVPMKTDMSGGAAVIAAMGALRALDVPVRVTGLVAAAENMPSGSAYRPGDVITQYGGSTVEVLNTDAEGRLVLADALAYADETLDPDMLIDIATLTGAASLGLGRTHAAMYSTDDPLADALVAAGESSGERLWRMPLVSDYRAALDSDVADLCHVSRDPHLSGGSITAALFLAEFAGDRRWVHLDVAGPARSQADENELTKGGTGFGTRVLLRWLEQPDVGDQPN